MSFVFANNLGETVSVSKCYNNPYDAYQNRYYNKKELCIVSDNKVIRILYTKMISVKWAVSCAKHVLHIFEEKYPNDKRPRKAIEAASNWIKDPSGKNKQACQDIDFGDVYYTASYDDNAASYAVKSAYVSASYVVKTVYNDFHATRVANSAYAAYAHYVSELFSDPNKSLEIKWQCKKLNQIVYEEILLAFVMTQYNRVDKKLVRKIPKELLEYIASFLIN